MPRIEALALYELVGRREALVAPNAYSGIRPAEARENLLLLLSDDGHIGVTNWAHAWRNRAHPDISWLVGLDPRALFTWGDGLEGRAPAYEHHLLESPALDVALLDLCARFESVPLWRILGKRSRDSVPAYDSTIHFEDLVSPESSVDDVLTRAHAAIRRGYRAMKIKVGRGLKWMPWPACTERDIEVCLAIRAAVGDDVQLMVDANRGFAGYIEDAVDFLAETAGCRFAFAEEMVDDTEVRELREAMEARGLKIPLAGGEEVYSSSWCEQVWPRVRLDVLQMDICRTGLTEYLAIARFARNEGIRIAPHNFGSQIGVYESVHLGAVVPEVLYCECDDSSFDGYRAEGYTFENGGFGIPTAAGLGIQTDDPRVPPSSDEFE